MSATPARRAPRPRRWCGSSGPALLVLVIVRMPDPRRAPPRGRGRRALWPLAVAVLLNVVNIHLKVVRWDVHPAHARHRLPAAPRLGLVPDLALRRACSRPGRVGDVLRAQYLRHDLDVPYAEGLASVVMDRLCDLYVLVAFVAVGVVRYAPVIVGRLACGHLGRRRGDRARAARAARPRRRRARAGPRLRAARRRAARARGLARFLEALRANVGRPLLLTIPLTVATFVVNYLQGWLIARAIGLPMTFFDATCLLAIASLLGLLPISVSGVGVRELFFSLAFPLLGFAAAAGVTFGLLVFFVIYLSIVAIGFVSWQIAPPARRAGRGAPA